MWEDIHESVDKILIQYAIRSILSLLHPRQQTVLICRFWREMTLKETSKKINTNSERARQIEAKALRILRSEKFLKEFKKLGIPWIDNHFIKIEREERELKNRQKQNEIEFNKECIRKEIERRNLEKSREKLKIINPYHGKPEALVYVPKVPSFPPHFVKLFYNNRNEPFLHVDSDYGSINRDLDPETYDKWLTHLIRQELKNGM